LHAMTEKPSTNINANKMNFFIFFSFSFFL
jgi:hypothetical protein